MKQVAVINLVGLSKRVLGKHTPFLSDWIRKKQMATIEPVLPAVTCSVQTTYLTGKWPREHGIVGNGWYFRDECEVKLWKQSNKLVQSDKVWDKAKSMNPDFTCANMFWWYNMYSTVDYSVTPRPQYLADGRKKPDCYSQPADIRDRLQKELGTFPLFDFWGPKTSVKSSIWIAEASKRVYTWYDPTLMLIYLPHLDYGLQKYGPHAPEIYKDLSEIDEVCKNLISYLENKGVKVMLLSEYGITEVNHPISVNKILREMGLLELREEQGTEILDVGASKAFALADHQVAHIYINDHKRIDEIQEKLQNTLGIEKVLDLEGKKEYHINHDRSGELVAIADKDSWFTYYYWLQNDKAPDFARTVDIHKKPGYDPVEMFLDPDKKLMIPRIGLKILKKKLGFRTLMDVISLNPLLIKGSHGRVDLDDDDKAIVAGDNLPDDRIQPTDIHNIILNTISDQTLTKKK